MLAFNPTFSSEPGMSLRGSVSNGHEEPGELEASSVKKLRKSAGNITRKSILVKGNWESVD